MAKPTRKQISTPATWSQTDFMSLLKGSFLAGCQRWEMVSAKDEGTGLCHWMARIKMVYYYNFSLRSRISLETLTNWYSKHKTLHLLLFPLWNLSSLNWHHLSPEFFTSWGIPFWGKSPFLPDNIMWLYTARDKSVSPKPAPVYMGQVPLLLVECDFQRSRYSGCRLL